MKRKRIWWLGLSVLSFALAPPLAAQGVRDEKLYEALSRSDHADEMARAARAWVGTRRTRNKQVIPRLNEASARLEKPELSYDAVLRRLGPSTEAKLLHEYTENGLVKLLEVSNPRVRSDVIERLRWVETLEESIREKTEPNAKLNSRELLASENQYVSLLLDLDAKTQAALFKQKTGALDCEIRARTVNPNADDPAKTEQPNYEVVYVLEFWSDDPARWRTFDKLSSPTTQKLTAGYYMVWCRKTESDGSVSDGEKKRVEVTEAKEIDLIVPNLKKG